jgi:dienelactone hydrolase
MPHLFGTPSKPMTMGYALGQIARACISSEFYVLAKKQSSPVTEWLRALCRSVHEQCGGAGVGALGMCLTGGFALALMVDESVMAPVLSQPSLPFPVSADHRAALGDG